jgi:REP element-mobilizing transposase RayT
MSTRYKFHAADGIYFISFATVGWTDVFTRMAYKDIFVESLRHCQQHKGLELYAWCLMTSHVHLVARAHLQDSCKNLGRSCGPTNHHPPTHAAPGLA